MLTALDHTRLLARDIWAAILGRVGMRPLEALRTAYFRSSPGSLRHALLRRCMWMIRYRSIDAALSVLDIESAGGGGLPMRLTNCANVIIRRLYWLGEAGYEPHEIALWRSACRKASSIVEIGANIGYYTIQGAKAAPQARYLAVEAHPLTAQLLRKNLALNGLERVTVEEGAVVGDPTLKSVQISIPFGDNEGVPLGTFVDVGNELKTEEKALSSVRAIFARDVILGADLVKLDIEGMEYGVLSAVKEYIETAKPTLFIEVLDRAVRLKEFLEALQVRAGYSIYAITPGGLNNIVHIQSVNLQRDYGTADVLAHCPGRSGSASDEFRIGE